MALARDRRPRFAPSWPQAHPRPMPPRAGRGPPPRPRADGRGEPWPSPISRSTPIMCAAGRKVDGHALPEGEQTGLVCWSADAGHPVRPSGHRRRVARLIPGWPSSEGIRRALASCRTESLQLLGCLLGIPPRGWAEDGLVGLGFTNAPASIQRLPAGPRPSGRHQPVLRGDAGRRRPIDRPVGLGPSRNPRFDETRPGTGGRSPRPGRWTPTANPRPTRRSG